MAMTMIDDKAEENVICPYNKAHVVTKKRFAFHLLKCKPQNQNYPNSDKIVCPFNECHVVDRRQLEAHMETCESRKNLDNFMYRFEEHERPAAALPVQNMNISNDECWDDELATSVLDSIKMNAEKKDVLRVKTGVPKAERKAFREEERRRRSALSSQPGPSPAASTRSPQPPSNRAWERKTEKFDDNVTAIDRPPTVQSNSCQTARLTTPQQPQAPPSLEDVQKQMAGLSVQRSVQARDKSNPWGNRAPVRQEATYASEFPHLPAGRGRGRV